MFYGETFVINQHKEVYKFEVEENVYIGLFSFFFQIKIWIV